MRNLLSAACQVFFLHYNKRHTLSHASDPPRPPALLIDSITFCLINPMLNVNPNPAQVTGDRLVKLSAETFVWVMRLMAHIQKHEVDEFRVTHSDRSPETNLYRSQFRQ